MATIVEYRANAFARPFAAAVLLVATLFFAALPATWAAPPEADHTVGTLTRVDASASRLVLSRDSETGDAVGQGAPTNVYVTAATVVSRAGKPIRVADLKVGERLLVATRKDGNRLQATRVRALPSTTPGNAWGLYMHGSLRSIEKASKTVHLDQADTLAFVRIGYDAKTQAFDVDGKPIPLDSLKPGDELDMAIRKDPKVRTATKVVRLPPHGGP